VCVQRLDRQNAKAALDVQLAEAKARQLQFEMQHMQLELALRRMAAAGASSRQGATPGDAAADAADALASMGS